jgi:hypothetical protein
VFHDTNESCVQLVTLFFIIIGTVSVYVFKFCVFLRLPEENRACLCHTFPFKECLLLGYVYATFHLIVLEMLVVCTSIKGTDKHVALCWKKEALTRGKFADQCQKKSMLSKHCREWKWTEENCTPTLYFCHLVMWLTFQWRVFEMCLEWYCHAGNRKIARMSKAGFVWQHGCLLWKRRQQTASVCKQRSAMHRRF